MPGVWVIAEPMNKAPKGLIFAPQSQRLELWGFFRGKFMKHTKDVIKIIAIRLALSAATPAKRKQRIVDLAVAGIISFTDAFWAIQENGLSGE